MWTSRANNSISSSTACRIPKNTEISVLPQLSAWLGQILVISVQKINLRMLSTNCTRSEVFNKFNALVRQWIKSEVKSVHLDLIN
ncbi:hypothetical protein TSAR_010463 [Trichomalopsis sarcophagae]|uniref:Uncharacterized protein n=1 Tax=Trichomalopsis sarcophagae TaxID=543379 RepID=A0A232EWY1_9HYME|nr:hypothetical protein TSAR_010463 [Trichomalopsis sarcophagae]